MTNCFILAAGKAERHNGGVKPLMVVYGKTLLERMVMQVADEVDNLFLVTHRGDINHPRLGSIIFPRSFAWISLTLESTDYHWDKKNIVLLGDVYYTGTTMAEILSSTKDIEFFGDSRDIYAITFNEVGAAILGERLRGFNDMVAVRFSEYGFGKLGALRRFLNVPLTPVTDNTFDMDSEQELKDFIAGKRKHH